MGNDDGCTYYSVDEDSKTITVRTVMADEKVISEVKTRVDEVVPDEYKNGKNYSVDVARPEGSLDCNLTLISDLFDTADFQQIAEDLGGKIKELDLGIGYFNIAFQTDDYTIKALSAIDDLSLQDVAETSITLFD